jgi:hypothetical protein
MWTSHFAPAFFIKPFTKDTPLWVLAIAGSLADLTWLALVMLNIEKANYTPDKHVGCFPYDSEAPFSHSLLGEIVLGALSFTCGRAAEFNPIDRPGPHWSLLGLQRVQSSRVRFHNGCLH